MIGPLAGEMQLSEDRDAAEKCYYRTPRMQRNLELCGDLQARIAAAALL